MKVVLSESVLLIFVLNNHEPMHDDDRALFKAVDGLEYIVVVNKIDLTPQLEMDTVRELAGEKHVITTSLLEEEGDRKSTRLNSSHVAISYAVFCLKKKKI